MNVSKTQRDLNLVKSGTGTFTTTSTSYVDATHLTVTINRTGKPVCLMLIPQGEGFTSYVYMSNNQQLGDDGIQIVKDGTNFSICNLRVMADDGTNPVNFTSLKLVYSWNFLDTSSTTGSTTYKVQVKCGSGTSPGFTLARYILVAYEL